MEILKLIVCTIIMLAFTAAIMWVCNAWNGRIFILYVATTVVTIVLCLLLDD